MTRVAGIYVEKNYKGEVLNVTLNWKKFKDKLEPILVEQGVELESAKEKKERLEFVKMRAEGTPIKEVFDEIRAKLRVNYDANGFKINDL